MTLSSYLKRIIEHYQRTDLAHSVCAALNQAGIDLEALTRDDLTVFDEFHVKGRRATRELADIAEIQPECRLLDIGCGVGGPVRTLAADYACRVIGLDIMEEYCRTARLLTTLVHLEDRLAYVRGHAADLPFTDNCFDMVWLQHTIMNIDNKTRLFKEIRRVLHPQGRLAVHEVFAGSASPLRYPVPWASGPTIDFLTSTETFRRMVNDLGFEFLVWNDVSADSLEWFKRSASRASQRSSRKRAAPGIHLLMGNNTAEKMSNMVRNLAEDRIRIVQGIFMTTKSNYRDIKI